MELTERQVQFMLLRIDKRRITNFHLQFSMHAQLQGVKIPSLEELGTVSSSQGESSFDDKAAAALEAAALKRLAEKQREHE